tara:strand:- start:318 stop:491 length:174 start_codon:yes stop_codon:yes gene_type:complete
MYEVFLSGVGTIPNRKFKTVDDAVKFAKKLNRDATIFRVRDAFYPIKWVFASNAEKV